MTEDLSGLNLVQLLDLLEPVPEPAPIPMIPSTPIWGVIAALVAAGMIWAAIVLWRRRKADAPRRAALRELDAAGDDPARIAEILRRAAIHLHGRDTVASLTGEDWLAFLTRTGATGLDSKIGALLLQAPYRPRDPDGALTGVARAWLRKQVRPTS